MASVCFSTFIVKAHIIALDKKVVDNHPEFLQCDNTAECRFSDTLSLFAIFFSFIRQPTLQNDCKAESESV